MSSKMNIRHLLSSCLNFKTQIFSEPLTRRPFFTEAAAGPHSFTYLDRHLMDARMLLRAHFAQNYSYIYKYTRNALCVHCVAFSQ